jgi:hypothetical protein
MTQTRRWRCTIGPTRALQKSITKRGSGGAKKIDDYMSLEHGREIDTSHEQIVAHVILALYSGCCSQVRGDRDV